MDELYYHKKQFKGVMIKYWNQRYDLFENYDSGILLTKELWFSVTPYKMANFVTEYLKPFVTKEGYVLDGFCGGGGNIVSFINSGMNVVGIDINQSHIDCTQNNVNVSCIEYQPGSDQLLLYKGDWMKPIEQIDGFQFDVAFGSPPWGGPAYNQGVFKMSDLQPFPLFDLLTIFKKYSKQIVFFLPKNSDLDELKEITEKVYDGKHVKVKIIRMFVNDREKGILVHWSVVE